VLIEHGCPLLPVKVYRGITAEFGKKSDGM
jgi:hypothetical protein